MEGKFKKVFIFTIIFCGILFSFKLPVKAEENKKVLILNSYSEELQWTRDIQRGIESELDTNNSVLLYYEFMDLKNNRSDKYINMLYKLYKNKYKDTKFDVIICSDNDALNFMVSYGEDIFRDSPIVFCGINDFNEDMLKGKANFTGIVEEIDVKSTIDSILYMQPYIENIAIICDSTTTGKINEELAKKVISKFSHNVKFYFYKDLEVTEALKEIDNLGEKTAVLNIGQLKEEDGEYIAYERLQNSLEGFNKPIYVCWDVLLTDKIMGGKVIDGYSQGKVAAQMTAEILKGEKVENIPIIKKSPSEFIFNYNELNKYKINIDKLPSNYKIINKPFSVYEDYKLEIHIIIGLIIFLLIVIILLISNIRKRILTEKELNRNYEELNAVYEELAATEESLENQYNELQIIEERYKLAIDGSNGIIWEYSFKNKEYYVSDKFESLIGYKIDYSDDISFILKKLVIKEDISKVVNLFYEHLNKEAQYFKVECRILDNLGGIKWVFVRGKALIDSMGKPVKMSGSISDITERKKTEEKNRFLAFYDQLTGLPNKHMFLETIDNELLKCVEGGNEGAVFLIDIDNFKNINDTLGHDYGDEFLKNVSRRLSESLKHNEFICKLAGDEFLILKLGIKDKIEIEKVAIEILDLFKKPFYIGDKKVFTTASIGISMFPKDALTKNELLKNSDIAMYKAKEKGKNRHLFYSEEMSKDIIRKSQLIDGLRNSIVRSELNLLYQPQVDLTDGKVKGAEVLLRWANAKFGSISPVEFIPLAEQTELIVPIGEWVLKNACIKTKYWIDKGINSVHISVNVSVTQLYQKDFLNTIKEILNETKLPPEYLEIEITESILMNNIEENLKILKDIRDLGIKIALDDFGTGYSSLNYLRLLPINKLKLDKSFIDNIHTNKNDKDIVECIIKLAHEMNITVVAEGVELKEQLDILNEIECDKIQGYYFSKPISPGEFELLIK
ncbi:ABC transporter substrate binding protein [Clostridium sp. MB05]